jgi:hypothetical protein
MSNFKEKKKSEKDSEHHFLITGNLMKNLFRTKYFLTVSGLAAMTLLFAGTASAGLFPVTAGPLTGLAVYSNALDITWSVEANGNLARVWGDQVDWAAGLTLGTFSDWRLPSADVNGDDIVIECRFGGVTGCEDNEMGFLFWEEGITFATPGPFSNVLSNQWSGTESAVTAGNAWLIGFLNGFQFDFSQAGSGQAWAVHDGNIGNAVVPVPASVWLFGSALGLLGWLRRRRVN